MAFLFASDRGGEIMAHKVVDYVHDNLLLNDLLEPICEWILAWVRVMDVKKVVIVLCWWSCVVVLMSFNFVSL